MQPPHSTSVHESSVFLRRISSRPSQSPIKCRDSPPPKPNYIKMPQYSRFSFAFFGLVPRYPELHHYCNHSVTRFSKSVNVKFKKNIKNVKWIQTLVTEHRHDRTAYRYCTQPFIARGLKYQQKQKRNWEKWRQQNDLKSCTPSADCMVLYTYIATVA